MFYACCPFVKACSMKRAVYKNYLAILRQELVPALGCTEPISIAFACAKAREVLGCFPKRMEIYCSGNIIKNVKSVTVPNSGGLRGIEAAGILGAMAAAPERELEVLEALKPEHLSQARKLLQGSFCQCFLKEGVDNLYLEARLFHGGQSAEVTIFNRHTMITRIVKNGAVIYEYTPSTQGEAQDAPNKEVLNVRDILEFANTLNLEDVRALFRRQVEMNCAIAEEGLAHSYGAQIGSTILHVYGNNVISRARALSAAGSDARMSGCSLPVVINSGSGNQGITVTLPVVEFAKELGASEDTLFRALAVSNLISIYQKKYIGNLSAYCGAVSAACGAGAGITYLYGGDYDAIGRTIVNTIVNVGGILCDGAKPSCAAKIASSVEAAIMAHYLGHEKRVFLPGEGLVGEDLEETIKSIGYIGRVGMKNTDSEILKIMSHEIDINAL